MTKKIIFLGTPEFAVASLKALVEAGFSVVGVVTAPDKPAGRGMQLQQSAVKKYALEKGLHILQPEKLKAPDFLSELKKLKADVQVVVAFRMLPEAVWNMPPLGTINLHGSLLPQYRGAAPINWAIINGEKETGVTTFKLQHQIDTGDILLQKTIPIGSSETAGQLHDRMMEIGANVLVETIQRIFDENILEKPQLKTLADSELKKAPKLFTETCQINWNKSIQEIYNLIRGLSPYPAAFTIFEDKKMKIFASEMELAENANIKIGQFFTDHKTYLKCSASNGFLHILNLQWEGKKRMSVADFLRGFRQKNN